VHVAGEADAGAIAALRRLWRGDEAADPGFERRLADWLAAEGDRRTTWLATLGAAPVAMASVLEYRRMPSPGRPDSWWGYVGNVFVREDVRNRGVGSALLATITATADERGYARLVLAPSARAVPFFARAGFSAAGDGLLVREEG
jgi:GNAT superfamily N-acetyltransferase